MKYVVVNGSYRPNDYTASLIKVCDDLEDAKNCCNKNLAEDFGYESFEELLKEEYPVCDSYKWGIAYSIELEQYEHEEVYKVYPIEV